MTDPRDFMDEATLRAHHTTIGAVAGLINLTSAYMGAPDGSGAEEIAEGELTGAIDAVSRLSPEKIGNAILAFTSLIVAVADPDDVQEWFNQQAQKIAEALG